MNDKAAEAAVKIADNWYRELHGRISPIFQKQKLREFAEAEIDALLIAQERKYYEYFTEYVEVTEAVYTSKTGEQKQSLIVSNGTFKKYVAPIYELA
ncbi:MAG: hypothetical protein ACOYMF_06155 [Bacteroidales bacterium]